MTARSKSTGHLRAFVEALSDALPDLVWQADGSDEHTATFSLSHADDRRIHVQEVECALRRVLANRERLGLFDGEVRLAIDTGVFDRDWRWDGFVSWGLRLPNSLHATLAQLEADAEITFYYGSVQPDPSCTRRREVSTGDATYSDIDDVKLARFKRDFDALKRAEPKFPDSGSDS